MHKFLFLIPTTALLFSCSENYNAVHMELNNGTQIFVGETIENIGYEGTFNLASPEGTTCEGAYSFKTELTGKGNISCSNKQKGTFVFAAEKNDDEISLIKGYGRFENGEKFSITFGEAAPKYSVQQNYQNYQPQPIYEGQPPQYKGQINIPFD